MDAMSCDVYEDGRGLLDLEVYKHSGVASKDYLRPFRLEHSHASSTLTPPALGRTCHSSALSGSVLFVVAVTMR